MTSFNIDHTDRFTLDQRERDNLRHDALCILSSTLTGRWPVFGEPAEMWVDGLSDEQLRAFVHGWLPTMHKWDFVPRTTLDQREGR